MAPTVRATRVVERGVIWHPLTNPVLSVLPGGLLVLARWRSSVRLDTQQRGTFYYPNFPCCFKSSLLPRRALRCSVGGTAGSMPTCETWPRDSERQQGFPSDIIYSEDPSAVSSRWGTLALGGPPDHGCRVSPPDVCHRSLQAPVARGHPSGRQITKGSINRSGWWAGQTYVIRPRIWVRRLPR